MLLCDCVFFNIIGWINIARNKRLWLLYESICKLNPHLVCTPLKCKPIKWAACLIFMEMSLYRCVLIRFSCVQLFATLRTVDCQAPLSKGFSRQEQWNRLHFLLQGIFLTQGSNPPLFMSSALAGGFFTTSTTWTGLLQVTCANSYLDIRIT